MIFRHRGIPQRSVVLACVCAQSACSAALLRMCSAIFCDNILVEADIFTILGFSFCVMRNAFNFIQIKKRT